MKDVNCKKIRIPRRNGKLITALVISPRKKMIDGPLILWLHGGGYFLGMKEMVFYSRAIELVKKYNAVVVSPSYRLALFSPYPAALNDSYDTLLFMKNHAKELGGNVNQIMVGGESSGGGLAISLSLLARDKKEVNIAYLMPIYPMIDNYDTPSSVDNHGKVWNTKKNHLAWTIYLRSNDKKEVSPYASPSREKNYKNLPPTYTFVGDGEPFFSETCTYIENLKRAGCDAKVDIYPTNIHAFHMLKPHLEISKKAIARFNEEFEKARKKYFAPN